MVMSSTIGNVIVPDVTGTFGIGQDQAHWISTGFLSAMGAGMIIVPVRHPATMEAVPRESAAEDALVGRSPRNPPALGCADRALTGQA